MSSDIWRVDLPPGPVCVKRALARLQVKADWRAPVERSGYEAAWIEIARGVVPARGARAAVRGPGRRCRGDELPPAGPTIACGRRELQDGRGRPRLRRGRGRAARGRSMPPRRGVPRSRPRFPTDAIFHDIRLEPYLLATGRAHPPLAPALRRLARRTATTKLALVHGDVSPKNILVGPDGPVFLDAECAWYGDPAFDLAFCLNHLLLKCLWAPAATPDFLACFDALARQLSRRAWPGSRAAELEARAGGAAAGPVPRPHRRQVAGRVRHRRRRDKERVRRVAGAFLLAPSETLAPIARGLGGGAGAMSATTISRVLGRRVWDSRGRPTVEAEIHLAGGAVGRAIAPAGASTGSGEAVDLRDGGERFGGHDVTRAVANVNGEIAPALLGLDGTDQAAVDARLIELDGTPDKRRLGGNATIAVSMAAAHARPRPRGPAAVAAPRRRPTPCTLPLPEIQIFGGGAHAAGRLDIQDFLVVCPGAASFAQALDWTAEVYRAAGRLLAEQGLLKGVADEGGYWPEFAANEEALAMLAPGDRAGRLPARHEQVAIALDVAASQFGRDGRYRLARDGRELDTGGMIELLLGWLGRYPIVSIEDPLAEDDPQGFVAFTRQVRRPLPRRRRRLPGHRRRPGPRRRPHRRLHRGAAQAQPARHADRDQGRLGRGPRLRPGGDRLRPLRRERGRHHRPSRRRLGRAAAQGRLLQPLGADGQVERGPADRRGAGPGRPVPRARGAGRHEVAQRLRPGRPLLLLDARHATTRRRRRVRGPALMAW